MNILVAGGSGFIGSHIVRELVESCPDAVVRILTRKAKSANPWGRQVAYAEGDVTVTRSLSGPVEGVDAAVHCVQFPNHPVENPAKGWTYERVDGQGTRNLVEACAKAGVRRFVYLSGAGAGPGKVQPWFRAKHMAEEAVRQSGMEYAILRPSWVYGPEDRSLNRFVSLTRHFPFVPVIGNGKAKVQPISVFDIAKVAALCATRAEAPNRVFELGGPQELSMNEILRTLQKVLGKRRPLIHSPVSVMRLVASALALLPNPPLTSSAIDFILMEERVDPSPAEEFFGMKFESLETGLRRYLS